MHLGIKVALLVGKFILECRFRHEFSARVVLVSLHSKCGERYEVDSIAVFECCHIAVTQCYADNITDTGIIACGCSHPEYVVVAPLYVPTVVIAECVHDDMGARSTVVDIAKDMQLVDNKPLDDVADSYDKVVGTASRDYRVDDGTDVIALVLVVGALVKQLLNNVREVLGQVLAHL